MGTLTWEPRPNSVRLRTEVSPGSTLPRATPAIMQRATQADR